MGKRSRQAVAGLRPRTITAAQRKARKINMAFARKFRKHGQSSTNWLKGQKGKPTVSHPEVDSMFP